MDNNLNKAIIHSSLMNKIKKLSIKRFESALNVETYYNNFAKENEIISADVKIVEISKFKPSYLLTLEYVENL